MIMMAIIQMLLLCAELSLAYKVPARFLREPGEKYGVKYEMPKQFIVKELLDSKSSLLSSEETTFDDSPDTEEGMFDESYSIEKKHKRMDSNAANENFDDSPGSVITLPERDYNDDLFRKKRSDAGYYLYSAQDHLPDHLNMELEEDHTPLEEPQDAMASVIVDEFTTQESSQETSNSEMTESSAVEDVTNPNEQDAVTPETLPDTNMSTQEDVSTTVQDQSSEHAEQDQSSTEQGVTESQESSPDEELTPEIMQDTTTTTINPNIYTAPPFDLLDFIARFESPLRQVENTFSLFNLAFPADY